MWREAHLLEEVLAHVGVHRGQGVVQEEGVPLAVDRPGHAQPLLLPSGEVDASLPWVRGAEASSPISVRSPAGSMAKSLSRAQALTTLKTVQNKKNTHLLYNLELEAFPKRMLFFTVAFWTQACWGT